MVQLKQRGGLSSPGGPGGEANSFAWAFALNISSEAFGFTGLEILIF